MHRGYFYLLVGMAAFLLFLVARLPASVAHGWLPDNAVRMAGLTGTAWNGAASQVVAGGFTLGETSWDFRPTGLLAGQLSFDIDTLVQGLPVTGIAGLGLNGNARLRSLRGKVSIRAFDNLAPTGFFDGAAEIDLSELELDSGWPVRASGRIFIENLRFLAAQSPLDLGSYEISFAESGGSPVLGTISDTAGGLAVDAQLVLSEDRCYELDGTITSHSGAAPQLARVLSYLGPAGPDGRRPIERKECL